MAIPSEKLIARLKKSEGFRARPYLCPEGYVTIGYGHNLEAHPDSIALWSGNAAGLVKNGQLKGRDLLRRLEAIGMVWVDDRATDRLRLDVDQAVNALARQCPAYAALMGRGDEPRAEVLVDMCFNMGWGKLKGFKRMLAAVEAGDYQRAAEEMLDSRWAVQVKGRAQELARIMISGEA